MIAMSYGNVYVARVAMGGRDEQTLRAFIEAEAYDGPALIIAYSHRIAHGINMMTAMRNQKAAVESGQWLLTAIILSALPTARIRSSWTRARLNCPSRPTCRDGESLQDVGAEQA